MEGRKEATKGRKMVLIVVVVVVMVVVMEMEVEIPSVLETSSGGGNSAKKRGISGPSLSHSIGTVKTVKTWTTFETAAKVPTGATPSIIAEGGILLLLFAFHWACLPVP